MTLQYHICPSILSVDIFSLHKNLTILQSTEINSLHIDIMDGHFVPNISFGPNIISSIHRVFPKFSMECHLMVTHPEKWIDKLKELGATSIIFHIEAIDSKSISKLLNKIKLLNMKTGIAINPDTEIDSNFVKCLNSNNQNIDTITIMSVHPGFGGQSLIPETLKKVEKLRKNFPLMNIEVDGGVKLNNIASVIKSGANSIVSGTGIFGEKDVKQVILDMRGVINKEK